MNKYFNLILLCFTLVLLPVAASAKGKVHTPPDVSNYAEYRVQVDSEIAELGYTDLRTTLSTIIHEMPEPWDLTYFDKCNERHAANVEKFGEGYNGQEDCAKHLVETRRHRFRRLELIIDALVLELPNAQDKYQRKWFWSKEDLAFIALVVAFNESGHFDPRVHLGWKRGDCRPVKRLGGKVVCHSFSNFQIWSRRSDKYYRGDLVGYDEDRLKWSLRKSRNATFMAYSHLVYHSMRCILGERAPAKPSKAKDGSKYPISMYGVSYVLSGYGSGKHCAAGFKSSVTGKPHWEPVRRAEMFWKLRSR